MRILYGVQGTGNGHITRARAMQKAFAERRLQVDFLLSGRERSALFDMEAFGDFEHRPGLSFNVQKGRVRLWATLCDNDLRQFLRDVRTLDLKPYDLVLTDFEPVTAWAGRRAGIPVIGTGHQYAFRHRIPIAGYNPVSAAIMRHFAPVDHSLGFHWHHFDQPILPPLFEPRRSVPSSGVIVVYLPFEDTEQVCQLLARCPDQAFAVYTPFPIDSRWPNVRIHAPSRQGFQDELAACDGVFCNAGFELASEALQLGKRLLVKPLHGQMEQLSNALALERLRLGHAMHQLDAATLQTWLNSPSAQTGVQYPDVASAVVNWLLQGQWQNTRALVESLWAATHFERDDLNSAPRLI